MNNEVKKLVVQANLACAGCGKLCYVMEKNMKQVYAKLKKEGWRHTRKKGWKCSTCMEKDV